MFLLFSNRTFNILIFYLYISYASVVTIANDPSVECQKGAVDCLTLLGKRIKEHFAVKSAD